MALLSSGYIKLSFGDKICPFCGKNEGFRIGETFFWEHKKKSDMKCENCDWIGTENELLYKEEFKNINRTKLIDKILND